MEELTRDTLFEEEAFLPKKDGLCFFLLEGKGEERGRVSFTLFERAVDLPGGSLSRRGWNAGEGEKS